MGKGKIMDLIYDKLADNDEQEQFDHHEHTDNMAVVNDNASGEPLIAFTLGDKEYVLRLTVNEPNEWEVFDYNSGFNI